MPVLLREALEYPQLMQQQRVELAQHGVETKIGVMDGNMKLAGRMPVPMRRWNFVRV